MDPFQEFNEACASYARSFSALIDAQVQCMEETQLAVEKWVQEGA